MTHFGLNSRGSIAIGWLSDYFREKNISIWGRDHWEYDKKSNVFKIRVSQMGNGFLVF